MSQAALHEVSSIGDSPFPQPEIAASLSRSPVIAAVGGVCAICPLWGSHPHPSPDMPQVRQLPLSRPDGLLQSVALVFHHRRAVAHPVGVSVPGHLVARQRLGTTRRTVPPSTNFWRHDAWPRAQCPGRPSARLALTTPERSRRSIPALRPSTTPLS